MANKEQIKIDKERLQRELDEIKTEYKGDRRVMSAKMKELLLGAGKDILNVGKKVGQLPGALTDSLNALAKGKLKINIAATELEDPMERLGSYVKYVVLSVIACVLFIGSCILAGIDLKPKTENGIPVIAMAGIVFSIALAIYSVGKLTKKK